MLLQEVSRTHITVSLMPDGKMMVGCTYKAKSAQKVPVHESKTTSWWDASQIYGVTLEEQYSVRTMKDGKLKIQQDACFL
jgi:hypothetical protein